MARILVTGASTGLGLLTATSLAEAGHDVVLHARNSRRLDDPSILDRMHGAIYGDLSDEAETRRVAEQANGYGAFDAVIYNAGVIDGPELIAVNVVAPYLLIALTERPSRMIVLSSSMHLGGSPRHATAAITGHKTVNYSDSKLYVTALTFGVARRWPDVLAHPLCPGWVPTRMGGPSATDDLTEGHRTQEWLATAPESEIHPRTGGYWHHRTARTPHRAALDPCFQDEVIDALEARTSIALPR